MHCCVGLQLKASIVPTRLVNGAFTAGGKLQQLGLEGQLNSIEFTNNAAGKLNKRKMNNKQPRTL